MLSERVKRMRLFGDNVLQLLRENKLPQEDALTILSMVVPSIILTLKEENPFKIAEKFNVDITNNLNELIDINSENNGMD